MPCAHIKDFFICTGLLLIFWLPLVATAQTTYVVPGEGLCECLDPADYLLLKKKLTIANTEFVSYYANIEVLISFLSYYGLFEPHVYNLNYPDDLLVGVGDLSSLLTGFNIYPTFSGALCSWNVVVVASHGWILDGGDGSNEAYIHESSFDEFDGTGDEMFGACDLNSFDLEMVYSDSVVMLTFAKRYAGGGAPVPD